MAQFNLLVLQIKLIFLFISGLDVSLPLQVNSADFAVGLSELIPSLSAEDIRYYKGLKVLER